MLRQSFPRFIPLGALIAFAALFAATPAPAQGASFAVNATHDAVDAAPGDGVCADAGGACTLRAAVMETNALAGADEISLSPGTYALSIAGTGEDAGATGDLDVTGDLTITGAGAQSTVIDAQGIDRIIHSIGASPSVTISDVTIRGGSIPFGGPGLCFPGAAGGAGICASSGVLNVVDTVIAGNASDGHGGGIVVAGIAHLDVQSSEIAGNSAGIAGGGVFNFGTAAIRNSQLRDNTATNAGGGISNSGDQPGVTGVVTLEGSTVEGSEATLGGGIYNGFRAEMHVSGTTIAGNTGVHGGGLYNSGGVIYRGLLAPAAVLTIADSTVRANSASVGGGVFNGTEREQARLTVRRTTIAENRGRVRSGGIHNAGTMTISESTLSANTAALTGGGFVNGGPDPAGNLAQATVHNSTISGNSVGDKGGGIGNDGIVRLTSATIVRNSAPTGGNLSTLESASITIANTIVAEPLAGTDCAGPITSLGHNLDSDGTCDLNATGDFTTLEPGVLPLASNGGPTQTHALERGGCVGDACLAQSPAIDAGTDESCPGTDQRGRTRPFDGDEDGSAVCDIGAFELSEDPPSPTLAPSASPSPTAATTPSPAPSVALSPPPSPGPTAVLPVALPPTGGPTAPNPLPTAAAVLLTIPLLAVCVLIKR